MTSVVEGPKSSCRDPETFYGLTQPSYDADGRLLSANGV